MTDTTPDKIMAAGGWFGPTPDLLPSCSQCRGHRLEIAAVVAERDEARAENERLREALAAIVDGMGVVPGTGRYAEVRDIARAALSPKEDR